MSENCVYNFTAVNSRSIVAIHNTHKHNFKILVQHRVVFRLYRIFNSLNGILTTNLFRLLQYYDELRSNLVFSPIFRLCVKPSLKPFNITRSINAFIIVKLSDNFAVA